ncbi:MAG TPA: putative Ig domain-containing protein, partial [Vicinamibacterales bacterium]
MSPCSRRRLGVLSSFSIRASLLLVMALGAASTVRAQALTQTNGSNFGTFSIGDIQQSLTATGGTGPGTYVWSVVGGALPPGVSLVTTNLPSFFPASASAGLIGVATTPNVNPYGFTLRVSDGSTFVDKAYTLKITGLSVGSFWDMPDAFVGVAYPPQQLTVNNAAGPVTWTPTGGVPAGMTLSSAGVLSGTPTAAGFRNINFSVTDGVD